MATIIGIDSINNLNIDLNKEQLEKELKDYANNYLVEKTQELLNNRLQYEARRTNDLIGKTVSKYLTSQKITNIIDDIFKQTDIEKIIKECIERQIGKKVKKLLEEY